MAKLRNLLALAWLGTLIGLLFSNLGSPLALTLLLSQTPALPLGLWLAIASLAGALTTLAIALLNRPLRRPANASEAPETPQGRRRRPWKRSPEDEWTFMGVGEGEGEESWETWPGTDAARNTGTPESEVIDTSFRILRPAPSPEPEPSREPRRPPRPAPSQSEPAPGRSPAKASPDDWDFVESEDW